MPRHRPDAMGLIHRLDSPAPMAQEGDRDTLHRLTCYLLKPPVSLQRLSYESRAAKVVYHGKYNASTGRDMLVCAPPHFLALVMMHVPARAPAVEVFLPAASVPALQFRPGSRCGLCARILWRQGDGEQARERELFLGDPCELLELTLGE